jgi:hypothetical protein
MKLICETLEDITVLKESREDGKKDVYIQGPFLMGEDKNRNGRVYPVHVLAKEVSRYNEHYIDKNRAFGELGHPAGPSINLDRVSHIITKLEQRGNHFYGKAKLTETPMGDIAKGILDSGGKLGVSSRGMGTVTPSKDGTMVVGDDFMLATAADIVADPSAHIAFVEAVMENTEWVYNAASGSWLALEHLDNSKKIMHKSTMSQINENSIRVFEQFLNKLVVK